MSRTRSHTANGEARHRALFKVDELAEDADAAPVQTIGHVLVQGALENA